MRRNKIIYSLNIGDIQDVAEESLERKLTDEELKKVIDRVGDFISWYNAIDYTFSDLGLKPKDEEDE